MISLGTIRTGLSWLLLAGMLLVPPSVLATKFFEPVFNPELTIEKSSEEIKIDGNLNDIGWTEARKISNFVERYPGDNTEPEVTTVAYVSYDENQLYVAFVCVDDPMSLRATMCQRDQFDDDDAVRVMIDTYGEASWAYELFVNPYGVQKDHLWSNVGGSDDGFDLIWEAAAQITDSGYQVEMAVPFTSMRFPNRDQQTWKMDFWRERPRESFHQYSWAAYDRNQRCWPCQWGTIDGIGNARPGKGLEALPAYVANQSSQLENPGDPDSDLHNGDVLGEFSLGGKYAVSSDMTLEASYNPDFSQIEADAAQVDVNTTIALFYPERRPFFQEGADVFRTLFNSFYTRTVNDPQYAVKFVSRKPGLTLGFMSAQDENTPYMIPLEERSVLLNTGKSWVNVLRGSRSVGEASQVGFIVTDRRLDGGGYGSILGVDGDISLTQNISLDGQLLASFTGEPDEIGATSDLAGTTLDDGKVTAEFDGESFHGYASIARLRRFARHWSFILDFNQVEPSYRTQTGYDPWVNYRHLSLWNRYTVYPESGLFQRLDPQLYMEGRWLFDGTKRWERQNLSLNGQLRWAQTFFSLSLRRGSEAWTSSLTGELVDYNDLLRVGLDINSQINNQFGYDLSLNRGRTVARFAEAVGGETSVDLSLDFKPVDRFVIEPDVDYIKSTHSDSKRELFRQFIVRSRFGLQVSRELSVRLVIQYNDSKAAFYVGDGDSGPEYFQWSDKAWDIDPLITYRLSPFSVLYMGSTHDYTRFDGDELISPKWKLNSRQFFIKLQYLFRV